MTDTNIVMLVGRLTRDIEVTYTTNGFAIGKISLACNSSKKVNDRWEEESNFFDVTMYGKQTENIQQYLRKGQQIAVSGSLHQDRWEKDGQKYSKVKINANTVQLLGGNNSNRNQNSSNNSTQNYSNSNSSYSNDNMGNASNSMPPNNEHFSEDIPF